MTVKAEFKKNKRRGMAARCKEENREQQEALGNSDQSRTDPRRNPSAAFYRVLPQAVSLGLGFPADETEKIKPASWHCYENPIR